MLRCGVYLIEITQFKIIQPPLFYLSYYSLIWACLCSNCVLVANLIPAILLLDLYNLELSKIKTTHRYTLFVGFHVWETERKKVIIKSMIDARSWWMQVCSHRVPSNIQTSPTSEDRYWLGVRCLHRMYFSQCVEHFDSLEWCTTLTKTY